MNNEKLMKIFAVAKINQNYSLFTIHFLYPIHYGEAKCDTIIVGTGVLDCPFGLPILPSGKGSGDNPCPFCTREA